MPDNTLSFTTRVDLSGLESGMAQAASTVKSSATTMAEAMAAADVATKNLSEAQKQLGSAAAGSRQAAAVIQQYEQAVQQANTAVLQLSASQQIQTATARVNASANAAAAQSLRQMAAPAVRFSQAAQSAAIPALRWSQGLTQVGISARQGAAAGIGILEGRMMSGNRAAAAFLSTTLGLGPVIEAAFPVIGALALVEVLVDIGREAFNAYEKFVDLDTINEKLYQDAIKLKEQDFINVKSIEDATLRLQDAEKAASNLRTTAQSLQGFGFQQLFSGNIAGGLAAVVMGKGLGDDSVKSTQQAITLDQKKLSLQHEINVAQIEAAHSGDGALQGQQKINAELQKRLALNAENQRYTAQSDKIAGNVTSPDAGATLKSAEDETARGEARAQSVELARSEYTKLLGLEQASGRLIDEEAKKEEERYKKLDEIKNRASESLRTIKPDEEDASSGAIDSYVESQIKLNDAKIQAYQIDQDNANSLAEATIRAQAAEGTTTALGTAQAMAAQHASEYKQQLAELNAQLQVYENAGKDAEAAQTRNQISQVQGKQAVSGVQDQAAIVQQTTQPWMQGANQIADAWMGAFDNILRGGRSAWDAVQKAGEQTVLDLINDAERWALKWLEKEALTLLTHKTTEAQKVAATATANAATAATTSTTNVALVTSNAAVAASGAAASVAAIPVIGWATAPGVAAAMFAETEGYAAAAAFDVGTTYVPKTGMAIIHEGEAIFPRPQADQFRSFLRGGGGNNGSTTGSGMTLHYSPTFESGGTPSDSRRAMRELHGQLRRQGLVQ